MSKKRTAARPALGIEDFEPPRWTDTELSFTYILVHYHCQQRHLTLRPVRIAHYTADEIWSDEPCPLCEGAESEEAL